MTRTVDRRLLDFAPMRRALVIVMMLLLPLQSVWAAAASVCGHETGRASHFGHHEHAHQDVGDVQRDGDASGAQPVGGHADCGVCHGIGTAVFGAADQAAGPWSARDFVDLYRAHLPDPPVEAFLRPPLPLVG